MFKPFTRLLIAFFLLVSITTSAQTYNPLWIPDTMSGNYFLTVNDTFRQFFPGQQTITAGVNGNWWGPTLIFNKGDTVQLQVKNNLFDPTTMHWHGIHLPAAADGGPHQVISPGATWSPSFIVTNNAATYWYHPHLHMMIEEQLNMGIGGFIIIRDSLESTLNLPRKYGIDDIPLVLTDRRFDAANNQLVMSHFGDTMVVNGTINPEHTVPAQIVRMRILNAAPERFYRFGFSNNASFRVIATDGGLIDAPVIQTRFTLAPGERVEILVNFTGLEGTSVDLVAYNNTLPGDVAGATAGSGSFANALGGRQFNMVHFNVGPQTTNAVTTFPLTLANNTFYNPASATKTRRITMSDAGANCPPGFNGCGWLDSAFYNFNVINQTVIINTTEIWEIQNVSAFAHPFHMHNVQFYILDRNGVAAPSYERGWKDVMQVRANTTARFITRFTDYADSIRPYMYHCHNVFHEDGGMMGQFLVIDTMRPPDASVLVDKSTICEGSCVTFTGMASTNVDHFNWSFPGGSPATDTLQQVTVCYSNPGTYTVTLIETNQSGSDTLILNDYITVHPKSVTTLTGKDSICVNDASFLISGTPAGGIYSGVVSDSLINPALLGAGMHKVYYTYTNNFSCTSTDSVVLLINPLPQITFNIPPAICVNATSFSLSATPSGGSFIGTGVSLNSFDPSIAGTGDHYIYYSYKDSWGCGAFDSVLISVTQGVRSSVDAVAPLCSGDNAVSLQGNPSGGQFSGPGVNGNLFNPTQAGAGVHTVNYIYTALPGCSDTSSVTITVNSAPLVQLTGPASVCINQGLVSLNTLPTGGVLNGPALSNNDFDPALAGSGIFQFIYTYTDQNNCTASDSLTIEVFNNPAVSLSFQDTVCITNSVPLSGSPSGGVFSGTGVSGSIFNASQAGPGSFLISYIYTDNNNCSSLVQSIIHVEDAPQVIIVLPDTACITQGSVIMAGNPPGGTFSGPGVFGNLFVPVASGLGNFYITYTWPLNGCQGQDSSLITVDICSGISEYISDRIQVFPNPTYNEVTIVTERKAKYLSVINATGQEVLSDSDPEQNLVLSLENFTPGLYYLRIDFEEKSVYLKISKL